MPRVPYLVAGLILALCVAGCGEDPAVGYLQAQPEYDLTYPNSTLMSETSGGSGPIVDGTPYVTREFKTPSTLNEVGAWYGKEIGTAWVGGLRDPGFGGSTYAWQRPCLSLYIDADPPIDGETHYEVTFSIQAGCQWQRAAAAQSLRDQSEASLTPSGATPTSTETSGATLQPGGTTMLWVESWYESPDTRAEVLKFYDSTLSHLGWTRVDPPSSQTIDTAAIGKWQKGLVLAVVKFDGFAFAYGLSESLDSQGSPMPPPSGLSLP